MRWLDSGVGVLNAMYCNQTCAPDAAGESQSNDQWINGFRARW